MEVRIDTTMIVRGGDWDNHAVCEIPTELLIDLAKSPDELTAFFAQDELSFRKEI